MAFGSNPSDAPSTGAMAGGGRATPSPAVSQAAVILRLLARAGEPMSVTAIARETGISQSSCFNLLKTLAAEDLLRFDEGRKQYAIGLGILHLARGVLGSDAVLRAALPLMNELSGEFAATIGLWRANGRKRMTLVALGDSTLSMRIHMEVGQRQPLAAGATGRAWLSAADCAAAERKALFDEVRWQQPVSFAAFEASIAEARARGFAVDSEMLNRSIVTVASPIRSHSGGREPLLVLSASAFAGGIDAAGRTALGQAIARAAARLASQG